MTKHTMDLTTGSVTKKLMLFTLPILASNLLQHFYNAADTVVVGKFANDTALAAVGSTGSLTALILSLFTGLAAGTNVVCANHYGARNREKLRNCMHTSVLLGVICGIGLAIVGVALARPLQVMMGSPESVIDQAVLYVRIYFCGVPASLVYNFAAAILRAHGDTKRPMIILALSGVVNVLLNLLFVIVLHMDVAGVALATISSQYLSMVAVLYLLYDPKGECAMQKSEMRLDKEATLEIVRIGVPSGINGAMFSLSNVIVQSTINSFGDIIMAGNAASGSIGGFVCLTAAAFSTACVSFAGQCRGAKQYKRIDQLLVSSSIGGVVGVCIVSVVITLLPRTLLGLYSSNPEVIESAVEKTILISWGYVLYAVAENAAGCLRGMGYSTMPTILNICGICIPRVLWIYCVFPWYPTYFMLNLCFPVSWLISMVLQVWYYLHIRKKLRKVVAW